MSNPRLAIPMFIKKCNDTGVKSILDIGSGSQEHTRIFEEAGFSVTTNDLRSNANLVGHYTDLPPFNKPFDAIWCAHVLEHQRNVGLFLDRIFNDLKVGGVLGITVPPLKHEIVGGHLTLWNAGLLLYNLILAGFDCSDASVATYGYNISIIIEKTVARLPKLKYDNGDIELLKHFFPKNLNARQAFPGQIKRLNWDESKFV